MNKKIDRKNHIMTGPQGKPQAFCCVATKSAVFLEEYITSN